MPAKGVIPTSDSTPTYDVVVVGGGAIGLACAWLAGERGLTVALVDPNPRRGASWAAAGMLAPVTELHYGEEALLQFTLAAAARYPSFVAELEERTGLAVGYRECGTLALALDAGDQAVLDDLRAFQLRLGLDAEVLSRRECRALEPMLAPAVHGGLLVRGDHQVDSRRLTAALLMVAERSGVTVVDARVTEVVASKESVTGVRLADGSVVGAGTVVLAAGAWSGQIAGLPDDVVPPVRPVKGQVLRLQVPQAYRPFLTRTVRGTVRGFPVYLVPREDGELVVGATQEELGYDEQVTAGGVYQLLRDAHALVPGLTELPLVEVTAGLRPGSPDNAPMIGPTRLAGLVLATGHYRNGVLLAPVTADAVAQLLVDGTSPPFLDSFSPLRFAPQALGKALA